MTSTDRMPARAGIGLRLPHIEEAVATRPSIGWLEIHPENFLANPHATELLQELAGRYPISVHTVGLSVGSVSGIDRAHLRRVRTLIDLVDPVLVSGHLAWSTHGAEYLNDLLPLPFDHETLQLVAAHLREVQAVGARGVLAEDLRLHAWRQLRVAEALPHRLGNLEGPEGVDGRLRGPVPDRVGAP